MEEEGYKHPGSMRLPAHIAGKTVLPVDCSDDRNDYAADNNTGYHTD